MFQVSTLQALALGYSRAVINVAELMRHGDIGLGTFEDVNGEMIVIDGHCYRADENGDVTEADSEIGVPFTSVTFFNEDRRCELDRSDSIDRGTLHITAQRRKMMLRTMYLRCSDKLSVFY